MPCGRVVEGIVVKCVRVSEVIPRVGQSEFGSGVGARVMVLCE